MQRTWKEVILQLRLAPGHRVTDGQQSWDVERDGFGRYTLRGVEQGTKTIWDSEIDRTPAPENVRIDARPSSRRQK